MKFEVVPIVENPCSREEHESLKEKLGYIRAHPDSKISVILEAEETIRTARKKVDYVAAELGLTVKVKNRKGVISVTLGNGNRTPSKHPPRMPLSACTAQLRTHFAQHPGKALTRGELSAATGLSLKRTSAALNHLVKDGVIQAQGKKPKWTYTYADGNHENEPSPKINPDSKV